MLDEKVLIFGTVAYDRIETPFDKADFVLGGSASFAALSASFFSPVEIVSVVGNDFRNSDFERLSARGIDISGIEINAGKKSFFWHGRYHNNFKSRDTIEVGINAFENYFPTVPNTFKNTKYVLLANVSPKHQIHLLNQLEGEKFTIVDTMNLWIEIENSELKDLIKRADIFILNDEEARQLTGENNLIICGDIISSMGAKSVIIKKGSNGAMLFHKDGFFTIPAFPVRTLHDPTGAGDSFAGALAGFLAKSKSTEFAAIKKGMAYASTVASLTVESFSCDKLEQAGWTEIEKRMNHLIEISSL